MRRFGRGTPRFIRSAGVAALLVCGSTTSSAQTTSRAVSLRGFAEAGYETFRASRTFHAVFEEDAGPVFGGGGEVVLRSGIFVRVSASRYQNTGERAVRLEGEVFRLGIPLTMTIMPIEVSGGYRFGRRAARLVPYAGAGVSSHGYRETSQFATSDENVSDRFTGYQFFGGVEYRVSRWIAAAGEWQYATVPDAIGAGGLSAEFNEKDLGGTTIRARIIIGR
jgi:opacity protein-like surface antigen